MIDVGLEKIKKYVGYRLKDTNENIKRLEAQNNPVCFEVEKMLTGEEEVKKELTSLMNYIQQIEGGEL